MILRQISSLMHPKIQHKQVIMNVLHPGCARPPRWSPPVLWSRFEDDVASICVLIHSCKKVRRRELMTDESGGRHIKGRKNYRASGEWLFAKAMASAGPYANNLHLIIRFLQDG